MRSLKILWLNWRCWLNPEMGGAEIFTHEVAKRWVGWGNEVCLFTSRFYGSAQEEVVDGVRIVRAGSRYTVYNQAKKYYHERFQSEGYDIVIDEINGVPFNAHKFCRNNEHVVALIHQLTREIWLYATPFPANYFAYRFLENYWLKKYVDVPTVTVSESTKNDLVKLGFKNVSIVPEGLNFMPLSGLPSKDSVPLLVFAGRLKPAKRPDHALRAFRIIREKLPDARMWVFGDGPMREKLEREHGDVTFYGNLSNEVRRSLMARSWVLINPAVREGWGLNVIEANGLGVPCVAYNVKGLMDSVKHNETGLLVESGNVDALAECLLRVLQNDDERLKLSLGALKCSKEFNWDNTAKEFLSKLM